MGDVGGAGGGDGSGGVADTRGSCCTRTSAFFFAPVGAELVGGSAGGGRLGGGGGGGSLMNAAAAAVTSGASHSMIGEPTLLHAPSPCTRNIGASPALGHGCSRKRALSTLSSARSDACLSPLSRSVRAHTPPAQLKRIARLSTQDERPTLAVPSPYNSKLVITVQSTRGGGVVGEGGGGGAGQKEHAWQSQIVQ